MDTYKFATITGDRTFLHWIHERMNLVYKENYFLDYMWTLRTLEDGINDVVLDAQRWNKLPRIIRWWYR
jgi:hypothetical protein